MGPMNYYLMGLLGVAFFAACIWLARWDNRNNK